MRAINLISLLACLFISTAISAQEDSVKSKNQERIFRRFKVEIGFGNAYYAGKERPLNKNRLSLDWNITDHHSLGIQTIWSSPDENDSVRSWSTLATYTFNYFPLNFVPQRDKDVLGLLASLGMGVTTSTVASQDAFQPSSKTSFVVMPCLGVRYSHFDGIVSYHFVPGNQKANYFGFSIGFMFGGGVRNKIK
jgi:hypothetical protein